MTDDRARDPFNQLHDFVVAHAAALNSSTRTDTLAAHFFYVEWQKPGDEFQLLDSHLLLSHLRLSFQRRGEGVYSSGFGYDYEFDLGVDERGVAGVRLQGELLAFDKVMPDVLAEVCLGEDARAPSRVRVERGDITSSRADAIVNSANPLLLGGEGVDGAIHAAAGPQLAEAYRALPELQYGVICPKGGVRITPGFGLPARFVIHTVGPIWQDGIDHEDIHLAECYRRALEAADVYGLQSIAFPAISCGASGFPPRRAAAIAVEQIRRHFDFSARRYIPEVNQVTLIAFDDENFQALAEAVAEARQVQAS